MIEASLNAPRLCAGTAELAELILAFLPEVQLAIKQGLAKPSALDLPGIRTLAGRGGASHAVGVAQKIAGLLPASSEPKKESAPAQMNPPFAEVWPEHKKTAVLIEDGVTITITEAPQRYAGKKWFLFTLTLPDASVFHVVKGDWYYDLDKEGQCQAYVAADRNFRQEKENQVWLHWDTNQKRMIASSFRNWLKEKYGPLEVSSTPLPASLLTILVSLLAQDGSAVYFAPRLLQQCMENGIVDAEIIRTTTRILLQNTAVSPAKLVRSLENNVRLLPVFWPMLTECVKAAGAKVAAGDAPPVWINRVLDIALRYAPYLTEAARRGHIPAVDAQWTGLANIAEAKAKSAAVGKAKELWAHLPYSQ